MGFNTYTTIVIIASAIFFYRAAKYDGSSTLLWVVLSIGVSILLLTLFRFGGVGIILGQAVLFLGITIFRIIRES
jgi:fatty acid desaturase